MEKDIRIITLGETGVGKTSIINRICENQFNENEESTFTTDFKIITKDYKKKKLKLLLYFIDTVGQEQFIDSLPPSYIRNSHIVLLVFSNEKNFKELEKRWYENYKNNSNIQNSKFIVVANKSDTFNGLRDVINNLGEKLAEDINAFFITCSAKSKDNIDNLLNHIVTE